MPGSLKDVFFDFPFFSQLSEKEIKKLTSSLTKHSFRSGQNIIKQGDPCTEAHFLIEGKVEVSTTSSKGDRAHIIFHKAPALFGSIEIWRELPYLGTVTALEPSTTLSMSKTQYLGLLHSSHQACISIVQFLSDQVYQSGIDHRIRLFGDSERVLARFFLCQAAAYGEKVQGGANVPAPVNKSQVADSLGISRRHIIRAFQSLEKLKLIEVQKGNLFIPDLEKLREFAHSIWNVREKRQWRR
jgi:CRP-like cAMP-binding protein